AVGQTSGPTTARAGAYDGWRADDLWGLLRSATCVPERCGVIARAWLSSLGARPCAPVTAFAWVSVPHGGWTLGRAPTRLCVQRRSAGFRQRRFGVPRGHIVHGCHTVRLGRRSVSWMYRKVARVRFSVH